MMGGNVALGNLHYMSGQLHALASLSFGKRAYVKQSGWICLRGSLSMVKKSKITLLPGLLLKLKGILRELLFREYSMDFS
jgi:hypothetical protein